MAGPSGSAAVLKVISEDDHSKDTYLCSTLYQMWITSSSGEARVVDLIAPDDVYDRLSS